MALENLKGFRICKVLGLFKTPSFGTPFGNEDSGLQFDLNLTLHCTILLKFHFFKFPIF